MSNKWRTGKKKRGEGKKITIGGKKIKIHKKVRYLVEYGV